MVSLESYKAQTIADQKEHKAHLTFNENIYMTPNTFVIIFHGLMSPK